MSPVQANCPACGAPVLFTYTSSFVLICDYCNSAIARSDRGVEDLGKVVDLVDTGSPLEIGLKGVYQGKNFELTGHAQLSHSAGGLWDEWFAAFDDGRWGWITEAQGRFYVTFPISLPEQTILPSYDRLRLGGAIPLPGSVSMVVAEMGEAVGKGAKGEIPFRLTPGDRYYYADLSGANGEFATVDYSENPPLMFVGREVALAELAVEGLRAVEREAQTVSAQQLNCPNCAGPLELRAPDKTERVTCPSCGSLLDVTQGKLKFLQALKQKVNPAIKLGSVGEFYGKKMTLIGFMQRGTTVEGVHYYWQEYLLYNPKVGFHWLLNNNNHWSYIEPIAPGQVTHNTYGKTATFRNKTFKQFDQANGIVEYVLGEFYWKVSPGETAKMSDFINPPEMLSFESSYGGGQGEINWSLGTYITTAEIEKAFGLTNLTQPGSWKVAPNQPFHIQTRPIYLNWATFSMLTLVLWFFFSIFSGYEQMMDKSYNLPPLTNNTDSTQTVFTEPLELRGRKNIRVTVTGETISNSWLYLEGDFIDESSGLVQNFAVPVEYYYGVEDGESWTEGSNSDNVYVSALPAGTYVLRLEATWGNWQQPAKVRVKVEQGVPRFWLPLGILILLAILPVIVMIMKYNFEVRRWSDSPFNPYTSSGS